MIDTPSTSTRKLLAGGAAFAALAAALAITIEAVGVQTIQDQIARAGVFAPLAYIGIKTATYVVAPLSSGPIQLSSGILFGLWPGTVYTLIGEVVGGSIGFCIARWLGRPTVRRFVGADGMARVDQLYASLGGWRALLYARLFLFSIYDFISYAAGFTPIRFWQYAAISTVAGSIPTFLFVAVGATLAEERGLIIPVYAGVALLSILPFVFNRPLRRLFGLRASEAEVPARRDVEGGTVG